MDSVTEFEVGYIEELGFVADPVVSIGFGNACVTLCGGRVSSPVGCPDFKPGEVC